MSNESKKETKAEELKTAMERADAWNAKNPVGTQVAVVQDDGTRKIMDVVAAAIAGQSKGEIKVKAVVGPVGVTNPTDDEQEVVDIGRIRTRGVERRKNTEALRVYLNDEERLAAGGEVADGVAKVATLKNNLKSLKSSIDSQIQMAEAEITAKSELVRNGYEVRPVECELVLDFDTGRARKIRLDDSTTIEDRALRPDEREREPVLFPEVAAQTAAGKKDAPQDDAQAPATAAADSNKGPEAEPAMDELKIALDILRETKRAAATTLQKRMNVGMKRAIQILDALQARGIVGPANMTGGARDILVPLDTASVD